MCNAKREGLHCGPAPSVLILEDQAFPEVLRGMSGLLNLAWDGASIPYCGSWGGIGNLPSILDQIQEFRLSDL